jgi:hypothetical protein
VITLNPPARIGGFCASRRRERVWAKKVKRCENHHTATMEAHDSSKSFELNTLPPSPRDVERKSLILDPTLLAETNKGEGTSGGGDIGMDIELSPLDTSKQLGKGKARRKAKGKGRGEREMVKDQKLSFVPFRVKRLSVTALTFYPSLPLADFCLTRKSFEKLPDSITMHLSIKERNNASIRSPSKN